MRKPLPEQFPNTSPKKLSCSISSQTQSEKRKATTCTQTETNNSDVFEKYAKKITETNFKKCLISKGIPKILIVVDSHARNLSSMLSVQSTDFFIDAIMKLNALDTDLVEIALSNGKDVSDNLDE